MAQTVTKYLDENNIGTPNTKSWPKPQWKFVSQFEENVGDRNPSNLEELWTIYYQGRMEWKKKSIIMNKTTDYWSKILFTNPSARAGYDTRSIFKRSLAGLNSEFSFS